MSRYTAFLARSVRDGLLGEDEARSLMSRRLTALPLPPEEALANLTDEDWAIAAAALETFKATGEVPWP